MDVITAYGLESLDSWIPENKHLNAFSQIFCSATLWGFVVAFMLFNVKGTGTMEYEMQGIGSSKHEYATKQFLFIFYFFL